MDHKGVIVVEGLWKRYGLPIPDVLKRGWRTLRSAKPEKNNGAESGGPWALQDVSLAVRRGETLGIVGRNGAGKSTLLKVLAGVTPPTRGRVMIRGVIFPMIELNAGMHMELTGRENVRLLGAVMGLSSRQIEGKIDAIMEFCDLGEWFDRPVRKYSSGMLTRLGFAVAVNVDAEILLVDEVLAVGDIVFQRKCFAQIERMRSSEKTVVFVSHNLRQLERLCDRVVLLENGRIVSSGNASDVTAEYQRHNLRHEIRTRNRTVQGNNVIHPFRRKPSGGRLAVTLLDSQGVQRDEFATLDSLTIRVDYQMPQEADAIRGPVVGVSIVSADQIVVSSFTTPIHKKNEVLLDRTGAFECHIPELRLLDGVYDINLKILDQNMGTAGGGRNLISFLVYTPAHLRDLGQGGLVLTDAEWRFSYESESSFQDNKR